MTEPSLTQDRKACANYIRKQAQVYLKDLTRQITVKKIEREAFIRDLQNLAAAIELGEHLK
jgi:DNA/RNA endonuclease G (NUC1)